MNLRYFSTFTGIGGLDMGLEEIGAECVGFSEIKQTSINIYKRHYPNHVSFGDVKQIAPEDMPDFDVLTGGFPCQAFSLAGLRNGFSDKRGVMILYLYNILKVKQPRFAVLENVKGLLMHDGGKTYRKVFTLLESAGYYVRVVLLNALYYGSAQNRERIVFLCSREDFNAVNPEIVDGEKRFRDARDRGGSYRFLSAKAAIRMAKGEGFMPIGGYDRVNTLTTGVSSSGRDTVVVQEGDGKFRYLTELEGERLQGFPDGWTAGESAANRWFAIGNAVNCNVSRYLFENYLKRIWKI